MSYAIAAGIYLEGIEAPCSAEKSRPRPAHGPGTAVVLALGQSNAANAGKGRYVAGDAVSVFNIHDSAFYRAECPLPGASNDGASVWGRLADMLVQRGVYRSVVLIPIAVGGSFIREWVLGPVYKQA